MDNFQIETAQNIIITQNIAHITTRVGSYLLDLIIIGLYFFLIIFILNSLENYIPFKFWVLGTIFSLPALFYSLIFEVLFNGQTPGKMINKTRVVTLEGNKPTFGNYLLRWVLRIIDIDLAVGSVAILTILLNGKGQRLGDIAGGTTVISERKKISLNTLGTDFDINYQPTFPQVTTLKDSDIRTIKELFYDAKRAKNHKVIIKLSDKILEITQIKTTMKPVDFVEVVLTDYAYYTQT